MSEAPRQLTLDLPVEPQFGAEDFLVSPSNAAAYAVIERWPAWPDRVLRLVGPAGSGKSHLAAIFAERVQARTVSAAKITAGHVPDLLCKGSLVIEDADRAPVAEPALFHLLNLARERGSTVLITSRRQPAAWGLATPDLLSRLRLAPEITLAPPDHALLRAVLVELFSDRQLVVDTSVVDFLALHLDRSLGRAAQIVAGLDREALSRGRRITRPMAAAWLAQQGEADHDD